MAPVPLEGHQTPVTNMPQEGNRGGSISLGLLIDFIIQRTYHELTVLAELLPRKTDMERKIEIYNFSARTRQLFVRLLALVKWANSATKVEKSAHIMAFLDKQSLLFVDTADLLARMARETLVHARLPNFHLPAAVEVLTTGSYNRLPACIREKIVPPDPITVSEKKSTLQRLNQVIQHRLVTGNLLAQMKNLEIDAGRVTFRVEQEFSVSLTVMGDGPNVPWRLLDLEILVSDRETGDGKSLVHPMQTQYIHQLLQERLVDSPDPLSEVYHTLHYFCQSLQLEVLYSQTLRLIRDRLDDHIRIDKYTTGECLTISYWKELTSKDSGSELGYKLSVLVDQHDPAKPLAIVHTPSLANKELEVSDIAIRSNQLSMEYLLVHTIYIRTRNRLTDLKQELQAMFKGIECTLAGSPAILSVPVLQPCLRAELLLIAVDTHTGMLQCHIPQYEAPLVPELTAALNEDHSRLPGLISELRFWITQKRCEKTLQHLPATPHERLPLLYPPDHPVAAIGKHRIFVSFHRHPGVILIVAFRESDSAPCEIRCSFFLCAVRPAPAEHDTSSSAGSTSAVSANVDDAVEAKGHIYLRLESLIEFDTFVVTHGSFTSIDCESACVGEAGPPEPAPAAATATAASAASGSGPEAAAERAASAGSGSSGSKKRRSTGLTTRSGSELAGGAGGGGGGKRPKSPAYFVPELAHVVALCDEQVPFVMLAQELSRRDIAHQGLQIEANATALVLKLVQLPCPTGSAASPAAWAALLKRLLSVAIRVQGRGSGKSWLVEFLFYGSPLLSSHPKEQGLRRPVYFLYEMGPAESTGQLVSALLADWAQIVNLFALVHDLAEQQAGSEKASAGLRALYSVKSYNYSRLVLGYGLHRRATVTVLWDTAAQTFRLFFGKSPSSTTENAHALLKEQLEAALNRERSLAQLVHVLAETLQPLTSVCKLPILLQLGLCEKKAQVPAQTFILMPQCVTLMRIAYQNMYCLELCFRGAGLVSLRDGAYSRFDHSNVVEGFTPIQGLSTFLSQYVDKSAIYRRRSQSEDDNPPSPVTVGDAEGQQGNNGAGSGTPGSNMGFMGPRGPQSPAAQQQRESLRFHTPLTPPSGSNPNTPASPHTANMAQAGQQQSGPGSQHQAYGNSPGMSLNLASPPSLTPNTPNVLPHPSPGSGLVASPLNQMHAPSPAGLIPTSSPGPCASQVQVGHSPAGGYMQTGGHGLDGSPFPSSQSMASPAASNWAGSPSISRPSPVRPGQSPGHVPLHSPQQAMGQQQPQQPGVPHAVNVSRVLPQRSWAGAIPTLLTCETLDLLCSASKHPGGLPGPDLSPLERFLGCVYMRRQLQRFIQSSEHQVTLGSAEPGVIHFKVDTLQYRVSLSPQHMQSLHIKVQPLPEHIKQWNLDELQVLERFFEQRVAVAPYKPNSLLAFVHILNAPFNVLKDFVQIMRLELVPSLLQQQQFKWAVQFSLRAPPCGMNVLQTGLPGVMLHKFKVLFFLNFTRLGLQRCDDDEPLVLALPLVYDFRSNATHLATDRDTMQSATSTAVAHQLKRFNEYHSANNQECSIFPAVRSLLLNLSLPSESPSLGPQPMPGPGPMPGGQVPPSTGPPQMTGPGMQMMPGAQGPPQGPGPYRAQPMPPMNMMGGSQ